MNPLSADTPLVDDPKKRETLLMNQEYLHVLLIEDSPTDAQLFQHVFFRAATGDWQLVHVERLSEAIAVCQEQSFDVALLDLRLPDSEGLETIAQFHRNYSG